MMGIGGIVDLASVQKNSGPDDDCCRQRCLKLGLYKWGTRDAKKQKDRKGGTGVI